MATLKKTTKKKVKPVEVCELPKISIEKLNLDFGREDLNTLAAKINELIDHVK